MKKYQFYVFMIGIFLAVPTTQSNAQNTSTFHSDVDSSPIEAVIMINENENKTTSFEPNTVTIRVGSEILIANNSTSDHSVTSGSGPDDPMSGKQFDTDLIKPNGFTEYVANNLGPGNYSFYSSANPEIKGQLTVIP
jgi:plastocyanin